MTQVSHLWRRREEGQIGRVLDCKAVLKIFQPGQWRVLEPKSPTEESHILQELCALVFLPSLLFVSSRGMHGFTAHSDAFRAQQLELSVNYAFGSKRSESHISWLLPSFLSFPFLPFFFLFFFHLRFLECCLGTSLGIRYWWYTVKKTNILSTFIELHYLFFFMIFCRSLLMNSTEGNLSGGRGIYQALCLPSPPPYPTEPSQLSGVALRWSYFLNPKPSHSYLWIYLQKKIIRKCES